MAGESVTGRTKVAHRLLLCVALGAATVLGLTSTAFAAVHAGPRISKTVAAFDVPATSKPGVVWTIYLRHAGHVLGSDTGTSGTLSVTVPSTFHGMVQADVRRDTRYYSGNRFLIPRSGTGGGTGPGGGGTGPGGGGTGPGGGKKAVAAPSPPRRPPLPRSRPLRRGRSDADPQPRPCGPGHLDHPHGNAGIGIGPRLHRHRTGALADGPGRLGIRSLRCLSHRTATGSEGSPHPGVTAPAEAVVRLRPCARRLEPLVSARCGRPEWFPAFPSRSPRRPGRSPTGCS